MIDYYWIKIVRDQMELKLFLLFLWMQTALWLGGATNKYAISGRTKSNGHSCIKYLDQWENTYEMHID